MAGDTGGQLPPPLNFSLSINFSCPKIFFRKYTKCWVGNSHLAGNLGAEWKFFEHPQFHVLEICDFLSPPKFFYFTTPQFTCALHSVASANVANSLNPNSPESDSLLTWTTSHIERTVRHFDMSRLSTVR